MTVIPASGRKFDDAFWDWGLFSRVNENVLGLVLSRSAAPFITSVVFGLTAALSIHATRNATDIAAIWPANGFLLAALLIQRGRGLRLQTIALCFAANIIANIPSGRDGLAAVLFSAANVGECMFAAVLIRKVGCARLALHKVVGLVRFVVVAGLLAPLPTAIFGAAVASTIHGSSFSFAFTTWFIADSLGFLVVTPAVYLLWKRDRSRTASRVEAVTIFGVFALTTLVVFAQTYTSLLFLLAPVSVLIAFRLGVSASAATSLALTGFAIVATHLGFGPTALVDPAYPELRVWTVQLFCFVNFVTALAVAATVSERNKLQADFRRISDDAVEAHQRLNSALGHMSQGLCLFGPDQSIVLRNRQFLELYGLSEIDVPAGLPMHKLMALCSEVDTRPVEGTVRISAGEHSQRLADGRLIHISQRVVSDGGMICTYSDITAERQAVDEVIHRSQHDMLTELPNRRLFLERLQHALLSAQRSPCAVLLIDVDHFKSINDGLGHAAGDELLRLVATRLCESVREGDTVARLGGDEFAVLLVNGRQPSSAEHVIGRVLRHMSIPANLGDESVAVGLSIGVAIAPDDGMTSDAVLRAADCALYETKRNGRNGASFFNFSQQQATVRARVLEADIASAIERDQLVLIFQEIKDRASNIVAVEALLRWHHPSYGLLGVADVMVAAKKRGLVRSIENWALERALDDASSLPASIKIAVNVSQSQFADDGFVDSVIEFLAFRSIAPSRLQIEISEGSLKVGADRVGRAVRALRDAGVNVAIDDFGAGQASLSRLTQLPVDRIKISSTLISHAGESSEARTVLAMVIALARTLGISTTAKGVETDVQLHVVRACGCDEFQGFAVHVPEPLPALMETLRDTPMMAAS